MCQQCNYRELLADAKLEPITNRVHVLEVVGDNRFPLSAADIYAALQPGRAINRVTVYRILDLLVEHGVVERISTGGRAFYYGLAPNANHRPHPHFYCKRCGRMVCLSPDSLVVQPKPPGSVYPGRVDRVEVRVDGVCSDCENSSVY